MTRRRVIKALAILWTLIVLGLCWTPKATIARHGPESGMFGIPHFDKVVHATMFAIFAVLWSFATSRPGRWKSILAWSVFLAALTEVVQSVPIIGRDAGLDDGVFDIAGAVVGLIVVGFLSSDTGQSLSRKP